MASKIKKKNRFMVHISELPFTALQISWILDPKEVGYADLCKEESAQEDPDFLVKESEMFHKVNQVNLNDLAI